MNYVISNPSVRSALKVLDRILSLLSLVAIPLLVSVTIFWMVDRSPTQEIQSEKIIEATGGTVIDVSSPVAFHVQARKAEYQIYIRDRKGDAVYVYPEHTVQDSKLNLGDLKIDIPHLAYGQYTVHAQLVYWFNPFKDGRADFELAKLVVVN